MICMSGFRPNLVRMKQEKDVEGLIRSLRHDDRGIQVDAASILTELGAVAVEPLIRAMEGKYDVHVVFRETIHVIRPDKSYDIMDPHEISRAREETKKNEEVRDFAARILGNIGNPLAIEPLRNALGYADNVSPFFRESVELALEKLTQKKTEKLSYGDYHSEFHGLVMCKKGHINSPKAKVCWKCGENIG